MINLISLGGPQNGVFYYPRCKEIYGDKCDSMMSKINSLAGSRYT